jgi:glycosyltransferase involved in cell wall biosynthesis
MKLITIIIPTHNYGRYITETLDSLISQTYPYWECIIIDDGSVDNTKEVLKTYLANDSRFRYFYQECQGVSAARNVGLKKATGSYIQFLDADDILPNEKLAIHAAYLEENPAIDIIYSDVRYFSNDDRTKLSFSFDMKNIEWMPKVNNEHETITALVQSNIMPIHSPLSRADLLTKVGLFNSAMRYCEDWDYWFRCAVAGGQIRYLDDPSAIVFVRVHKVSASQNSSAMLGGGKMMVEQFNNYLNQYQTTISKPLKTAIRRARSVDLILDKHYTKGLLLGLSTATQHSAGNISLKDILFWFKETLFSSKSKS